MLSQAPPHPPPPLPSLPPLKHTAILYSETSIANPLPYLYFLLTLKDLYLICYTRSETPPPDTRTAIPMAICDSVTVSIGEETSGDFRVIFLVRAEVRSWNINVLCYMVRHAFEFLTLSCSLWHNKQIP